MAIQSTRDFVVGQSYSVGDSGYIGDKLYKVNTNFGYRGIAGDLAYLTLISGIIQYQNIINYVSPAGYIGSSNVDSGTINTISEIEAGRAIDELVGKVVKIQNNGDRCYGIVASNTSDTITFDSDLDFIPQSGDVYAILNTITLDNESGNSIVALDVLTNNKECAVVLPEVSSDYERITHRVYFEKTPGLLRVPIVAKGNDKIRGGKYAEIYREFESLELALHTYPTNHRDVINQNRQEMGPVQVKANIVVPTLSTASTTFVDMPGVTFTIQDPGNYMVFFNTQVSNTNNDKGAFFQLQKNGADVTYAYCASNAHSGRNFSTGLNFYLPDLKITDEIKMQFRTEANTMTASFISFTLQRVN